jgi:hypothetical protein
MADMNEPNSGDPRSEESRENFAYFTNEYAQALQAFTAIEGKAPTLMLMGNGEELKGFIEQFLEMARRTRRAALDKGEANFGEWFDELIRKAEALRAQIPSR